MFDLDNTLIYTDLLNNDSYNYALNLLGFAPINECKRITRDTVFKKYPNLNNVQKDEIIELKQIHFANNLRSTTPNASLFNLLESQEIENCMLWTSADETRVIALLEYYNIHNAFGKILFSNKINVSHDIVQISKLLECDLVQLVFYEDNRRVISELQYLKLNVIAALTSDLIY